MCTPGSSSSCRREEEGGAKLWQVVAAFVAVAAPAPACAFVWAAFVSTRRVSACACGEGDEGEVFGRQVRGPASPPSIDRRPGRIRNLAPFFQISPGSQKIFLPWGDFAKNGATFRILPPMSPRPDIAPT